MIKAALIHSCVMSIRDLCRKNVRFGLSDSGDKVKDNGGAVVRRAGAAHLVIMPLTVWLFFFFSVEFPQLSHLFNGDRGIATSLKNSSPCVWYKITCLLGSLAARRNFSAENGRG